MLMLSPLNLKRLALLTHSSIVSSNDHPGGTFALTPSSAMSSTSTLPPWGGLAKNANLYWWATTLLAVWFLFVHTPPLLLQRHHSLRWTKDWLLVLHLLGAGGIYLVCAHNALVTPTTFQGRGRPFHVWTGRVGMGLGLLGVVTGAILTWTRIDEVGLGFGIPISIGGVFQLFAQWRGYHFVQLYKQAVHDEARLGSLILDNESSRTTPQQQEELRDLQRQKKTYLGYHIGYMVGVFVAACGIPAVMRLMYGVDAVWPFIAVIAGLQFATGAYAKSLIDRIPGPKEDPSTATTNAATPLVS